MQRLKPYGRIVVTSQPDGNTPPHIQIPADGHCQYCAVAAAVAFMRMPAEDRADPGLCGLRLRAVAQEYPLIRANVAREIGLERSAAHFDEFFAALGVSREQYLQGVRNTQAPVTWGDEITLVALARYYEVNILVIQNGIPLPVVPCQPDDELPRRPVICLEHVNGDHYNCWGVDGTLSALQLPALLAPSIAARQARARLCESGPPMPRPAEPATAVPRLPRLRPGGVGAPLVVEPTQMRSKVSESSCVVM